MTLKKDMQKFEQNIKNNFGEKGISWLNDLDGASCKCLDSDLNLNAMILERIYPGFDLYSISDINEQIKIGVDIITGFPSDNISNSDIDRYEDWLIDAFNYQKEYNSSNIFLLELIELNKDLRYKTSLFESLT